MRTTKRTDSFALDACIDALVKTHTQVALNGTWDGTSASGPYFESCKQVSPFRGFQTIFTRDIGYHSSGWWKNPDFERCYHLSISFFDPMTGQPRPHDDQVERKIVKRLFGRYLKWVWVEPPYSEEGKRSGVMHYRLFCDQAWHPIKPRGEVYSKELTKAGWHSYSDVQDEVRRSGVNPNRRRRGRK